MPLTPHLVTTARPREKLYGLTDGHGLCLQITPEGSKRWRFRYRFIGVAKTISLGVYPKVGLAKARLLHADAVASLLAASTPAPSAAGYARRTLTRLNPSHDPG